MHTIRRLERKGKFIEKGLVDLNHGVFFRTRPVDIIEHSALERLKHVRAVARYIGILWNEDKKSTQRYILAVRSNDFVYGPAGERYIYGSDMSLDKDWSYILKLVKKLHDKGVAHNDIHYPEIITNPYDLTPFFLGLPRATMSVLIDMVDEVRYLDKTLKRVEHYMGRKIFMPHNEALLFMDNVKKANEKFGEKIDMDDVNKLEGFLKRAWKGL